MRYRVTAASTWWRLNGVNLFSAELISGLSNLGFDAELMLTRSGRNPQPMPAFPGLSSKIFSFPSSGNLRAKRMAFKRYLESRGPCIYLPNHDVRYSCLAPLLSERVRTVGILHSDDPFYYEQVRRLGESWDAIICVSRYIEDKTRRLMPELSPRIHFIPYGAPLEKDERKESSGLPLKLLYAGRLEQYQKNIFAIKNLLLALERENLDYRLTISGNGFDRASLEKKLRRQIAAGKVMFTGTLGREDLFRVYSSHDIFLLLSNFEGLPLSLLEAMGRGCIPLVVRTESGIPEILRNGENGYMVSKGDYALMARLVSRAAANNVLRKNLSQEARRTISEGPYRVENMLASYQGLFSNLWDRPAQRHAVKRLLPPPFFPPGTWTRPWDTLRRAAHYAKALARPEAVSA